MTVINKFFFRKPFRPETATSRYCDGLCRFCFCWHEWW